MRVRTGRFPMREHATHSGIAMLTVVADRGMLSEATIELLAHAQARRHGQWLGRGLRRRIAFSETALAGLGGGAAGSARRVGAPGGTRRPGLDSRP